MNIRLAEIEKFAFDVMYEYNVIIETNWYTGAIILTNPITGNSLKVTQSEVEDLPYPFGTNFINLLMNRCKELSVHLGTFSKYNRTNHGSIIPKGGN